MNYMTQLENGRGLSAPTRNRYFYGKLLDVHHLEMEQRYFLEMGRLVNRLTLGSGVLCGLHVAAGEGESTVVVSPGVAVDGQGREIMVTEPVTLDLGKLEHEEGRTRTDPDRTVGDGVADADVSAARPVHVRAGLVLCLSYHECDVEPSPVLVADCDLREDCVPGAVRERFKFTLMPIDQAPLPEDPCSILRGPRPTGPAPAGNRTEMVERALAVHLHDIGAHPSRPAGGGGGASTLRQHLCSVYRPPCGPGPDCVPIALVGKGDNDSLLVEECLPRRTIYSNAVLLDLILCLAERVEECCNPKVTVTAPRVVEMWPAPPAAGAEEATPTEVKLGDFETELDMPEGGIAVSFDQEMDPARLAEPGDWLRVILLPEAEQRIGVALQLELRDVVDGTLSGAEGQTANYRVVGVRVPLGNVGSPAGLREILKKLQARSAWALVLMRSDDVTQIAAKDQTELLDADFHGSGLTGEAFDLLWTLSAMSAALVPALTAAIATPPTPMPSLPSGNGIEGGIFHSSFHITP